MEQNWPEARNVYVCLQIQCRTTLDHCLMLPQATVREVNLNVEHLGHELVPSWYYAACKARTSAAGLLCGALIRFFFYLNFFFSAKSYIQTGGETGRKIFHLLILCPSDGKGWSWANQKPAAQSPFQVSHTSAGSKQFGLLLSAFLDLKHGDEW